MSRRTCGATGCASARYPIREMRDPRRGLDDPGAVEGLRRLGEVIFEQAHAAAEEHGDHMDLHLVEQPRLQVLLDDLSAAPDRHVLAAGGLTRLLECGFDPVGDK